MLNDKIVNLEQMKLFREIKSYIARATFTNTNDAPNTVVPTQLVASEAEALLGLIARYNATLDDSSTHLPAFSYELVDGTDRVTLSFSQPVNAKTFGMDRALEANNLELLALEAEARAIVAEDAKNADLLSIILTAKFDGLVNENPNLTKLGDGEIRISLPIPNHKIYEGDAYQHRVAQLNERIEDLGYWIGKFNEVVPAEQRLPFPTVDRSPTMAVLTLSSLMEPERNFQNLYKLGCPRLDLQLLEAEVLEFKKSPPPPPPPF
ncbi:MAG: hypothetical protein J0M34_09105 [Alphaproteobacteria bacterium]|nr:hypothetical protein [Alphaproteobacteria bacterium]